MAILSPFVGAMADRGGHRKRYLLMATVVCVLGSIALYFPLPGQVTFALTTFIIANIAFEMANVFYNAFLYYSLVFDTKRDEHGVLGGTE